MEEIKIVVKICTVLLVVSSVTLISCTGLGALVYGLITKKARPYNKKLKVLKVASFVLTLMCLYAIAMYSSIQPYYYKHFVKAINFNPNRVEVSEPYDLVVPTLKEDVNILLGLVYPNGIVDLEVKENTGSKVIKGSAVIKIKQNSKGYITLANNEKERRSELAIANFLSLFSLIEPSKPCVYIIDKENNCAYRFYEFIDFVQGKEYKILYAEDDVESYTLEGVDYKVYMQCTLYEGTK